MIHFPIHPLILLRVACDSELIQSLCGAAAGHEIDLNCSKPPICCGVMCNRLELDKVNMECLYIKKKNLFQVLHHSFFPHALDPEGHIPLAGYL